MNWVLDHLQQILVVAGVIAYFLTQVRASGQPRAPEDTADDTADTGAPTAMRPDNPQTARAPEEDAMVRRIQDEIRRKIAERSGQPAPEGGAPTPPVLPRVQREPMPQPASREAAPPFTVPPTLRPQPASTVPPPVAAASKSRPPSDDEAQVLARQRELEEQYALLSEKRTRSLREARSWEQGGLAGAGVAAVAGAGAASPAQVDGGLGWLRGGGRLSPAELRRAVVWKEVLSRPPGLE